MTHSDPSSPSDDDIQALFAEEFDQDDQAAMDEAAEAARDEDRLYTDEFMRQNEMASRFLLLSVITAGAISVVLGCWYMYVQNQAQPSQNAPLQVPVQPPASPFPALSPNPTNFSTPPLAPGRTQPPSDSGILPNTIPDAKPTLPNPTAPNAAGSAVTPPPPPEPPSSTSSP